MKKAYFLLVVLLLAVAAAITLSIYKYNAQPKGITVAEATSQRDAAQSNLELQKQLSANDQKAIANLTAGNTALTTQKATLCAQIKAAKLVQPLCQ